MRKATIEQVVYFIANLFIIVPFVIRQKSALLLIISVGLLAANLIVMTKKGSDETSVATYLSDFLFLDMTIALISALLAYWGDFDPDYAGQAIRFNNPFGIVVLIAGVAFLFFGHYSKTKKHLICLGIGIIGGGLLTMIWSRSEGEFIPTRFLEGGSTNLAVYGLALAVWALMAYYSIKGGENEKQPKNRIIGYSIILAASVVLINLMATNHIGHDMDAVRNRMLHISDGLFFSWGYVVVLCIVFVVLSYAITVDTNTSELELKITKTGYYLQLIAGMVFLVKVLLEHYFSFNWVIFVAYVMCSIGLINRIEHDEEFEFSNHLIVVVELTLVTVQAQAGLWLCLSASVLLFYRFNCWHRIERRDNLPDLMADVSRISRFAYKLLAYTSVWICAYLFHKRCSADNFIMLATITGMCLLFLWGLEKVNARSREGIAKGVAGFICGAHLILCIMLAGRYGTYAHFSIVPEKGFIYVGLDAAESAAPIARAEYYWGITKRYSMDKGELTRTGDSLWIKGGMLTIVTKDEKGIVSRHVGWCPFWLRG